MVETADYENIMSFCLCSFAVTPLRKLIMLNTQEKQGQSGPFPEPSWWSSFIGGFFLNTSENINALWSLLGGGCVSRALKIRGALLRGPSLFSFARTWREG